MMMASGRDSGVYISRTDSGIRVDLKRQQKAKHFSSPTEEKENRTVATLSELLTVGVSTDYITI